jgi:dephospho-CoA kinase
MEHSYLKIGIIGKMCSGKTTLANHLKSYLLKKYNLEIQSLTFAGKVYDLAYDLFDMDKQNKDRKLLQQIGTYMRQIDENVWVKYVIKNTYQKDIFVEDCRYRNEFDALVTHHFMMIKIVIDEEYQIDRLKRTYPETFESHIKNLKHASEMDIDSFEEEKCVLVLNARDNELNFEKIERWVDKHLERNPNIVLKRAHYGLEHLVDSFNEFT